MVNFSSGNVPFKELCPLSKELNYMFLVYKTVSHIHNNLITSRHNTIKVRMMVVNRGIILILTAPAKQPSLAKLKKQFVINIYHKNVFYSTDN